MNTSPPRRPVLGCVLLALLMGCSDSPRVIPQFGPSDGGIVTIWSHTKPDTTPGNAEPNRPVRLLARQTPVMTEAMTRNLPATVIVIVGIDQTGRVNAATSQLATDPAFEPAALAAARGYRFKPERVDGRAVNSKAKIPIVFSDGLQIVQAQPSEPQDAGRIFATPGDISPTNPYRETSYTLSGQVRAGAVNMVARLVTENYDAELTLRDNTRLLQLKDSEGKLVFTGQVDTPKQRRSLTQDQLYIVERLNTAVVKD